MGKGVHKYTNYSAQKGGAFSYFDSCWKGFFLYGLFKLVELLQAKYSVTKESEYFYRGFLVRLEAERA
jgi:hypothetical protein